LPEISVLIPAFRPDYLDLAIASVLAQRFGDFELVVSDDSSGRDIEAIVSRWGDERIRYVRNPRRQEPGANRDNLLSLATGRFVKFLFDDDFLLPRSLELLHAAATRSGAHLVFHGRHYVDDKGRLLGTGSVVAPGQLLEIEHGELFRQMVGRTVNFIGEPSNVLIGTEALSSIEAAFGIDGNRMRFLTDVSLYLNLASTGAKVVGVGAPLSVFRRHGAQTSSVGGSNFAAGVFEWELVARWSADRGYLGYEDYMSAISNVRTMCAQHIGMYPELRPFLSVLPGPGPDGRYLTAEFSKALESGWNAVDDRVQGLKVVAA
jgi:glycosyltransferase involved in cell wall biosynthesis